MMIVSHYFKYHLNIYNIFESLFKWQNKPLLYD
jgi:hypothetical protein